MRNWLIRLLDGVTREEHEATVKSFQMQLNVDGDVIADLQIRLDSERYEVKRLSSEEKKVTSPPEQEPIALRGMSWMQRKSALEKKERARRESRAAHVRELENQWAERDTLEPTGPIERENTH